METLTASLPAPPSLIPLFPFYRGLPILVLPSNLFHGGFIYLFFCLGNVLLELLHLKAKPEYIYTDRIILATHRKTEHRRECQQKASEQDAPSCLFSSVVVVILPLSLPDIRLLIHVFSSPLLRFCHLIPPEFVLVFRFLSVWFLCLACLACCFCLASCCFSSSTSQDDDRFTPEPATSRQNQIKAQGQKKHIDKRLTTPAWLEFNSLLTTCLFELKTQKLEKRSSAEDFEQNAVSILKH